MALPGAAPHAPTAARAGSAQALPVSGSLSPTTGRCRVQAPPGRIIEKARTVVTNWLRNEPVLEVSHRPLHLPGFGLDLSEGS